MKGKFHYVNGQTISVARAWFDFTFGAFFINAEKNDKEMRFDIYLRSKIKEGGEIKLLSDFIDLDYFNLYWNKKSINNPPFKIEILESSLVSY